MAYSETSEVVAIFALCSLRYISGLPTDRSIKPWPWSCARHQHWSICRIILRISDSSRTGSVGGSEWVAGKQSSPDLQRLVPDANHFKQLSISRIWRGTARQSIKELCQQMGPLPVNVADSFTCLEVGSPINLLTAGMVPYAM